jgi:hypothetical protein
MKPVLLFLFLLICQFSVIGQNQNISTSGALAKYKDHLRNKTFLAFSEVREQPLRWFDSIPENRMNKALVKAPVNLNANPAEQFVFQIGVWAINKDLSDVKLNFSSLKGASGTILPEKMTCFNLGGTNLKGVPFSKKVNIPSGRVQVLWIGVDLTNIVAGDYKGTVLVVADGQSQQVPVALKVSGEVVTNHGYNQGARLSRLNWLNSTTGIDEEITKGYVPVKAEGNVINILGRSLSLAETGLPASITSFFDGSNEKLVDQGESIVNHSFRFVIEKENGETILLKSGKLTFTKQTPSRVNWTVLNTSDEIDLECSGQMEYDGFVDYGIKLIAKKPVKVKDIRLEIPVVSEKAGYMMGLGHEGGLRAPEWKWKWDLAKNQDMLWVGAVNGGLRVKWKAENYVRPLVNIYYEFGPLKMPPSWGNEGKGGVDVGLKNSEVVINAYSGRRELKTGDNLNYDFELLITPFRTIDRQNKFGDRYFHGGGTNTSVKIEDAKKAGANIINIHHAEDIYPFINYPYLDANIAELKSLVEKAHQEKMRMKFYYTTRELTKNLPEFWPFFSLNGEVIFPGPGNATRTEALHPKGPNEWLIKNLREKYIPAWYNPVKEGKFKGETDLSVITTPDSRLNNFYIAGLDWMVQNMGIDGVYIDDSALDRFTLRRARKIIDQYRPEGRIDMHSWNHFCKWAGFTSCLNLYMDLLPYSDLVWIGEGRDYNRLPDHWLIEVSGIPFGLPGQMLEDGGNPWRGMVYGITTRAGWTPNPPSPLWQFFDKIGIDKMEMIGYWDKENPVYSDNNLIKATIYRGETQHLLAIANWGKEEQSAQLILKDMSIDVNSYIFTAPEIPDFQTAKENIDIENLTIPGGKGYLIVITKKR